MKKLIPLSIAVLLTSLSACTNFGKPIIKYDLGTLDIENSPGIINLPFVKPEGVMEIPLDYSTLQILKLKTDGRIHRGFICMDERTEPAIGHFEQGENIEEYSLSFKISEEYGLLSIHNFVDKDFLPRDIDIPLTTRTVTILYQIKIGDINYSGPYKVSFDLNEAQNN